MAVTTGRCKIFIDGQQRAVDWHFELEVDPGIHDVSCIGSDGKVRTQTVRIAAGEIRGVYF